jgi:pimeloyl-ACP methyl ester carboxylesterase
MPGNLAVLDMNAADGIKEKHLEIESWYMSGHSLGGSMASSYIAENSKEFDGIILLASYSTADLSALGLDVLSIYGSNDGVLNMEKYEEYKPNLPEDFKEVVINGGCHAYFGAYGEQEGDKKATITREEQIEITVKEILQFINN